MLVVHDEIDLPFGDIRVAARRRPGRPQRAEVAASASSAAPDFHRVRVGVGRPDTTDPDIVAAHVLGALAPAEGRGRRARSRAAADEAERLVLGRMYAITYDVCRATGTPPSYERISRAAGGDGPRRARPARAARRRARARRRLRHRPRDGGARWSGCRAARVVAVDGSPAMVERGARSGSATASTCARPTCSSSSSTQPVDAILSTATFHWIADHDRAVRAPVRRAAARRPARRPVRRRGQRRRRRRRRSSARRDRTPALAGWPGPWNFAVAGGDRGAAASGSASPTCGPG